MPVVQREETRKERQVGKGEVERMVQRTIFQVHVFSTLPNPLSFLPFAVLTFTLTLCFYLPWLWSFSTSSLFDPLSFPPCFSFIRIVFRPRISSVLLRHRIHPPAFTLLSGTVPPFSGTLANHSSYPTPFGYLHTPLTGLRMFSMRTCVESASTDMVTRLYS